MKNYFTLGAFYRSLCITVAIGCFLGLVPRRLMAVSVTFEIITDRGVLSGGFVGNNVGGNPNFISQFCIQIGEPITEISSFTVSWQPTTSATVPFNFSFPRDKFCSSAFNWSRGFSYNLTSQLVASISIGAFHLQPVPFIGGCTRVGCFMNIFDPIGNSDRGVKVLQNTTSGTPPPPPPPPPPIACGSTNPLFFNQSVNLNPIGPRMVATFMPINGCTLDDVASAFGYDHFNWINMPVQAPILSYIRCLTGLPFFDPIPGNGLCSGGWADDLDYYWNEVNEDGTTTNVELDAKTTSTTLTFQDTPSHPSFSPSTPARLYTSLVGVRNGNNYTILDTIIWETTYNGTAGGVHILKNTAVPDPGSGTGSVNIVEENVDLENLPLAIRQFLASQGAENVPLPEPNDLDNDNVTDDIDNCQAIFNEDQFDADGDYVGDACDSCPITPNPEQTDGDGVGDACEVLPGDLDGDGDVDAEDFNLFFATFGKCEGQGGYNPDANYDDSDTCITFVDYQLWFGFFTGQ